MSKESKPINNTLKQKGNTMPTDIKTEAPNSKTTVLHYRIVRTYYKSVNALIMRIPSKQKIMFIQNNIRHKTLYIEPAPP